MMVVASFNVMKSFVGTDRGEIEKEYRMVQYGDDFCEGWEDGYCEGYKYVKGDYAICPITPICPMKRIGEDSYRDGYNRGFIAGMRAAQRG